MEVFRIDPTSPFNAFRNPGLAISDQPGGLFFWLHHANLGKASPTEEYAIRKCREEDLEWLASQVHSSQEWEGAVAQNLITDVVSISLAYLTGQRFFFDSPGILITGPSNTGKSALVCNYIMSIGDTGYLPVAHKKFDYVFWIECGQNQHLNLAFQKLAKQLGLVDEEKPTLDFVPLREKLRNWLANPVHPRSEPRVKCTWLMVFDDLQNNGNWFYFWWPPRAPGCTVITTTRQSDLGDIFVFKSKRSL
ncbi:hypothetical protein BU24DRAFT_407858 [Aaosphaeria arxii CBS 175.79]|uniref:NB-ARC domain-containing protein n=1 Tax=Aaosphaeria arxii CBS 175.79 TaxID=1450172 RepID=A0A6A5XXL1_9PLEO|nr:uncharacterized protein BU24DRAFT_407858 [Aaosphaeria arxii CBS 175.79]KAF2017892.1 hypothetical protein BU24DRAFT_407858 [Aaosphaeria arxii CBS 175.79]